ncbi:MAG: hypothetical protein HC902_02735 [Calothrix sp. SM1_5_4]|nr:hypothetical protein [Calothrix sp. SM1_5_4]
MVHHDASNPVEEQGSGFHRSSDGVDVAPDSTFQSETEASGEDMAGATNDHGLFADLWVWYGMGANYTSYAQSVPGMSDVRFGGIKAPSQVARAGFFVSDGYGLDLGLKITPGEVKAGSNISVSNGSYAWKTMSAELIYRQFAWLWRLGVQQHQMPFFVPLDGDRLSVGESGVTALSAGLEYRKHTGRNVRVEAMMRYQHPLMSFVRWRWPP